ncbi:MAG: hypothetical protein R2883_01320 [Caldisericia bacterium]
MKKVFHQIKMLFISPREAIRIHPPIWQSILVGVFIIFASFLLLLSNSLSPSIFGITLFPSPELKLLPLFLFSLGTQIFTIFLPMFIVYGKKGISGYINNFALIQLCCFGLALIGFLYHEIFWGLYKILPFSGLTANAVFEAIFLLYPALILVLFRYILLWMIATKNDSSTLKLISLVIVHLILSGGICYLGGLL